MTFGTPTGLAAAAIDVGHSVNGTQFAALSETRRVRQLIGRSNPMGR